MTGVANLAIYEGDDYSASITVFNADGSQPDLTNYTAQAQIRLGPADSNPGVVVEIAPVIVQPNIINLSIPNDVTSQLSGCYVWDLQLTDPNGIITTIVAGSVTVTQEITRESTGNATAVHGANRAATVHGAPGIANPGGVWFGGTAGRGWPGATRLIGTGGGRR